MWINSSEFSPAARLFTSQGFYTRAPRGSKEYEEFWDEQQRRCLYGYSVGGKRITGYHYHYLNFCPIMQIGVQTLPDGRVVKRRKRDFPRFYDYDYDYFWSVDIARYGITIEELDKLGLQVQPTVLTGGQHLAVLKARRKGYSYKAGSMLARNYYHLSETRNYAFASDKKFLEDTDGILTKTWEFLAFIDEHTAFRQPRLVDQTLIKQCGYKINRNGADVPAGKLNSIIGISLKDNPNRARGRAGELMFFEEMGVFPGLLTAWDVLLPTVNEGDSALGLMCAFGTGGTEGANFEGAEKLFYNPRSREIMPFNNIWDDGAQGSECGLFVPVQCNLPGFMDDDGNSLTDSAIEFEMGNREKRKAAKDAKALSSYMAEHPMKPSEAVLSVSANSLPTAELVAQYNKVRNNLHNRSVGYLVEEAAGVRFAPSLKHPPIDHYPHSAKDDLSGAVIVYQGPHRIEGKVPSGMYMVVHDPYAHDRSVDMQSLGAAYVIKKDSQFSPNYANCIVASYVGRPATQDDYNRNLFLLAKYYNAKIGFENDRGDVIGYAKRFKLLQYLAPEFEIMSKKNPYATIRSLSRSYGISMNAFNRKAQAEQYLRDWLLAPVTTTEDGEKVLILHTIRDPALLTEMIKFRLEGNFDRVLALMVGMYYLHNEFTKPVEAPAALQDDFFERALFV